MPQNPFPYTRIIAVDKTPGVPASGTVVRATDHNTQGAAMAYLVNSLPTYKVDPNDSENCFADPKAAYTQADSDLSAGEPVIIICSDGDEHDVGTWNLDGSRSVHLISEVLARRVSGLPGNPGENITELKGTINLQANVSAFRPVFNMVGIDTDSTTVFTEGSNWKFLFSDATWMTSSFTRTHGANGASVEFNNATNNTNNLAITDTDDAPSAKGDVNFNGGYFNIFVISGSVWTLGANVNVRIQNGARITIIGIAGNIFDFQGKTGVNLELNSIFIEATVITGVTNLIAGHANATVFWKNVQIFQGSGWSLYLGGATGTHDGAPKVAGDTAPSDPVLGTEWRDMTAFAVKVWNGSTFVAPGGGTTFHRDQNSGNISITNLATVTTGTLLTTPIGFAQKENRIVITGSVYRVNATTLILQFSTDGGVNWHDVHTSASPAFQDQNQTLKFKYELTGRGHGVLVITQGWVDFFTTSKTVVNCYKPGGTGHAWNAERIWRLKLTDTGNATKDAFWSIQGYVLDASV